MIHMKKRRLLLLFLGLSMMAGLMPMNALAEGTTEEKTTQETTQTQDKTDADVTTKDSIKREGGEIGRQISGDTIYYEGDVVISEYCSMEAAHVVIKGNLILEDSLIVSEDTKVEVFGAFRIQSRTDDGAYGQSSGAFTNWGYVCVHGDMYAQTTSSVNLMADSVLELKRSLMQIGSDTNFQTSARTGLILFSGEYEQTVSFDRADGNARLGRIEVDEAAGGLYLATPVYGISLAHDTVLFSSDDYSDIIVPALSTNGYKVTIEGNLVSTGYYISGEYCITHNIIVVDDLTINSDANVEVYGNLNIERRAEDGGYAETTGSFTNWGNVWVQGDAYVQTTGRIYLDSGSQLNIAGVLTQITPDTRFVADGENGQIHFSNEKENPVSFTYLTSGAQSSADSKLLWDCLKGKGLNDFAVAGIMGNLYAESALSPINLQNSYEVSLGYSDIAYTAAVDSGSYTNFAWDSAGYGLAQWTYGSRKKALWNFAKASGKSIGDLSMQVDFLWIEMQQYGGMMFVLQNANSVLEASNAVLLNYERPADQSILVQLVRAGYAQTYYDLYA